MKYLVALTALAALTLFAAHPGFSQTSEELKALSKEIEALKQGQKSIQSDLQELKTLLRTRQAPAAAQPPSPSQPRTVMISVDGAPILGNKDAKVTVIEFSDYQ